MGVALSGTLPQPVTRLNWYLVGLGDLLVPYAQQKKLEAVR